MKKYMLLLIFSFILNCSNDEPAANCNFLFNAGVNLTVNTNLPQFSQLQFPSNGIRVSGQGNSGLWLWRLNSSTLLAWDAADPSRPPESCTLLEKGTGDTVMSSCEAVNRYSLATGLGLEGNTSNCTLKPYRVDDLGGGQYLVTN